MKLVKQRHQTIRTRLTKVKIPKLSSPVTNRTSLVPELTGVVMIPNWRSITRSPPIAMAAHNSRS